MSEPLVHTRYGRQGRNGFRRFIRQWLIVLATAVFAPGTLNASAESFVIVANPAVSADSVSQAELRRVFLSLTRELGSVAVRPVNLGDLELKMEFMQRISGMDSNRIAGHFIQIELRGEGRWPPEVQSVEQMVRLLAGSRNGIGWLPLSEYRQLNDQQRAALKVLAVDGIKPGEADYRF